MQVTAEISLYPLADNYESAIIKFIKLLNRETNLSINSHAMSTYVKGENTLVFSTIALALETVNQEVETLSLVMKVISRDLPVEKGFLNFN